jgi:nitrite reductase/ring-hydroxylating ferredoxin subunit
MTLSPEWRCAAADLLPGTSTKFRLARGNRSIEGFIVHVDGGYHAYVNTCPHNGTPLDLWPNEFFADDGRTLICSTHGAYFEPATGRCIGGPCVGDALETLAIRREGDAIVVTWPG